MVTAIPSVNVLIAIGAALLFAIIGSVLFVAADNENRFVEWVVGLGVVVAAVPALIGLTLSLRTRSESLAQARLLAARLRDLAEGELFPQDSDVKKDLLRRSVVLRDTLLTSGDDSLANLIDDRVRVFASANQLEGWLAEESAKRVNL